MFIAQLHLLKDAHSEVEEVCTAIKISRERIRYITPDINFIIIFIHCSLKPIMALAMKWMKWTISSQWIV